MTDLSSSSISPGSSGGSGPLRPDGRDSTEPEQPAESGQHCPSDLSAEQATEQTAERPEQSGQSDPNESPEPNQHNESTVLPVFVNDPIVPLRLRLPGSVRHTLYHPGWYSIDENEESRAFLGIPGETLYGFERLTHLVDHMRAGVPAGLAGGADLDAVRRWTADEYAKRLCDYNMVSIPELANGELTAEEQGSVGSLLAVGLDLLDFLRIGGEHADALRQDEDISKLAAGDEVLAVFTAGRHRHHVVEMIDAHWGPCMAAVVARTTAPRAKP